MRIAIDMEGVLADSHQIVDRLLRREYGRAFNHAVQATKWNAWEIIGMTERDYLLLGGKAWLEYDYEIPVWDELTPFVIAALKGMGHEAFVLTARGSPLIASRKDEWIGRNMFGKPLLCQPPLGQPKSNVPFDVLIDDGPHNLEDAARAGRIAVAYDRPWNREWAGPRIKKLAEIFGKEGLVQ